MLTNGTVLQHRYRIDRLLSLSGTGGTYCAWDMMTQSQVTLKELTPQPDLTTTMLFRLQGRLQHEAKALMRLDHPNLVRVLDFFEEKANAYLVLTYVEGETLAERIAKRGAQREANVLDWAAALLDALAYCHNQGVIHQDIKPQNVLFAQDKAEQQRVMLVGFGLAKLWDPYDPRTWAAVQVLGTPEYASPEQWGLQPGKIDARSDLYCLGATLYQALAGHPPLTAGERMADPYEFLPLKELGTRVSEQTQAAILKAMELPRERRFRDAAEMKSALLDKPAGMMMPIGRPAFSMLETGGLAWGWIVRTGLIVIAVALLISLVSVAGSQLLLGRARNLIPPRFTATSEITRTMEIPVTATITPTPTASPSSIPFTPSPSPTLRPTSLAPGMSEGWSQVLVDAFTDNAHDWIVTEYADDWGTVKRTIANGTYRWEITAFQSVGRWCMPEMGIVSDFYLTVEAHQVSGPEDAAYGLVFRHSEGNYYLFSVRGDRHFRFSLWAGYTWIPIIDWTETFAIQVGEVNRLTVIGEGDHFTFYINEQQVADVNNDQLTRGECGLSVLLATPGDAVFEFDNFELREP
ncbi:MAG: protein kinase [Anaerolineae bacterium]|nr:protein kinase [Anaerolineae bacterium]